MEPGLEGGLSDGVAPVARNAPMRSFELELARLEDLVDERPSSVLELALGRRQVEVHPDKDAVPAAPPARHVAGPGTPAHRGGRPGDPAQCAG